MECQTAVTAPDLQNAPASELYEALDKPALLKLPAERFECSEWLRPKVHGDHHIEVDHHCYSVPYQLVHEVMEVRVTATMLEVFHRGVRVTAHGFSCAIFVIADT